MVLGDLDCSPPAGSLCPGLASSDEDPVRAGGDCAYTRSIDKTQIAIFQCEGDNLRLFGLQANTREAS